MTFIYFIGIQKIGNAIFHIYSVISIIVGFIVYDIIIKLIANTPKKWYNLYGDYMAKRRISKASKRRLVVFGTLSLVAIVIFTVSLIYNVYTIYELSTEKKELESLYVQLQEESENLKIDIEKFNDKNYLANYAREHYLYSKNGEYVIQLDKDDIEKMKKDIEIIEKSIDGNINKKYIIIGLSIFMAFIFIYIISKGKKRKK